MTNIAAAGDNAGEPLRLEGASNFRDFGGGVTAGGRRVRRGLLYRSERLSQLSDTDLERLLPLGIALVCDLRGERERKRNPSRWPPGYQPDQLVLDLSADLRAGNEALRRLIEADPSPRGARQVMIETYRMLPGNAAAGLRELFKRLGDGTGPVLIHCTAGKDRTGFICASILHALGVAYEDILADYLLSAERIDLEALAPTTAELLHSMLGLHLDGEALAAVNGVAREYLDAAYAAASARFGSFDAYLEAAGLDGATRERLHVRLLK